MPIKYGTLFAAALLANWLLSDLRLPLDADLQAPIIYAFVGITVASLGLMILLRRETRLEPSPVAPQYRPCFDAAATRNLTMPSDEARQRDKPWLFRTYAGHSTARDSNSLFRTNLAKGQTGLSVAFDLPTQTGYDADHPLARGEVGKVGVPVSHIGDMRVLFENIPLDRMNTSMTINATAAWLLALYVAVADEQGLQAQRAAPARPRTTSSRNTFRAAPMYFRPSRRCD